jgi:non-canonical (house-cleaning) NTP pyrophosphatase
MRIIKGTKNRNKITSVSKVFSKEFSNSEFESIPLDAKSLVPEAHASTT